MKALTVQQPWAWAIMHGGKNIENRTQQWSYRGPLAIHAGQRISDRGMTDPRIVEQIAAARQAGLIAMAHGAAGGELAYRVQGVILGVVDLVDVHPDAGCCRPWGESAYVEHGGRQRRRVVHLVLENVRPLPEPIACNGALGLWTPSAEVLAAIDEQLHQPNGPCWCEDCCGEIQVDEEIEDFGFVTLTPKPQYL